jgi:mono/diheme cytochrome c family protein
MRLFVKFITGSLALVGMISLGIGIWLLRSGVSAQPEPSSFEASVARRLRAWMIPDEAQRRANPVPATAEAVESGLEHFADHCAVCHANDGSGRVEIGENLYPRVPDMRRSETQSLSDGALFYIIEEGVRLTGMPGWKTGTAEGEQDSWHLVHFIRHLPKLTDAERRRMEQLNPRPAEAWRQEQEVERFLAGEDDEDGSMTKDHEGGHR